MNPPIRNLASTDNQIIVDWTILSGDSNTGASTIINYGLEWDAGTNGATWTALTGATAMTLAA